MNTVTESALIDLERQRDAMARRARNFDPVAAGIEARSGDSRLPDEYVDALTAPVRLEITFKDPIATRQQIEVLQGKLVEALMVTQDHGRGINRQRMDLRNIVKEAAELLAMMNGKTPAGRKRSKS